MNKTDYKRLGDYIREVDSRNRDLAVTRLLGVSISKEFMPSIANTIGTDMSSYKIVTREQLLPATEIKFLSHYSRTTFPRLFLRLIRFLKLRIKICSFPHI